MVTRYRTRATPMLWGWGFALLSFGGVVACAILGLTLSVSRAAQEVQVRLSAALTAGDFRVARSLIALACEPRPLDGWYRDQSDAAARQLNGTVAEEISSLLDRLRAPKTSTLTASIERAERGLQSFRVESQVIQQKWDTLGPALKLVRDNSDRIDQIAREISVLGSEDEEGIVAFSSVSARLAKALGLPHADPSMRVDSTATPNRTPLTYGSGALKGLPVLPQIPDGLKDLTELAAKLKATGGAVTATGQNAHEEFLAELSSIRVLSTKLIEDHARRTSRQQELGSEKTELVANSARQQPRITVLAHDLILTLVSPVQAPQP